MISTLLYLLSLFLTPNMIDLIKGEVINFDNFKDISTIFMILGTYAGTFGFWIFIIISLFLALHMNLSRADIKGAMSGLFLLLGTILIVDIILGLISLKTLQAFSNIMLGIATTLNTFLILALVISLIAVGISFIYKLITRKMSL